MLGRTRLRAHRSGWERLQPAADDRIALALWRTSAGPELELQARAASVWGQHQAPAVCRDADGSWRSESATSHFSEDTGHVANLVGRVRARGSAPRSLRADAHHSGSRKETARRERAALGDGGCGLHPNVRAAPHLSSSAVALMLSSAQLREDQRPSWPLQRKAKTSEFRPGAFERCRPAGGVRSARARSSHWLLPRKGARPVAR